MAKREKKVKEPKEKKEKKPAKKLWGLPVWAWVVIAIVVIGGIGSMGDSDSSTNVSDVEVAQAEETTQAEDTKEEEKVAEVDTQTEAAEPEEEAVEEVAHRDGMVGVSESNAKDLGLKFSSVRNDKTGKWKIATMSETPLEIQNYAASIWENFGGDDQPVLWVVNFGTKTTTQFNYMMGMIDVTIHEYVEDEEHDASELGGGMVLNEYYVYLDNGDIEKVQ